MKKLVLILIICLAAGKLFSQPYYYNSGDPAVLSNWGNQPGGAGTAPPYFGEYTSYIIESGKTVNVNNSWVFIAGGSTLEVSPGATLIGNNQITLQGCFLKLDSAGTYIHNNTANPAINVFAGSEDFNQYSTVKINNWSNTSLSLIQLITYNGGFFGNLEINWTSCTGDWYQFIGFQVLCKNDLRITSTGTGRFLPGTIGTSQPIVVVKNYYQTGGEVDLSFGSTLNGIATTLSIQQNFEKTGGIIDANGTNAFGIVYFGKVNPFDTTFQTFYNSGTFRRVRVQLATSTRLRLLSDMPLTTNSSICGLSINPNVILDCGIYHISGAGPITSPGNVTFRLGSPFGFKTGTEGNITTTGVKTISQFSDTLEYNGTVAQVTGDSIPFSFPGTLKINNPNGVSLNKSYRITNPVKFTNGKLNLENFDLISTVSQTAYNLGVNENRFFNTNGTGYYKEYVGFGGQRYFYVGNGSYSPVMLNLSMTSADTMAIRVSNTFSHLPKDTSRCVRKSWSIVESTPGGTQALVSMQWIQSVDNGTNFSLNSGTLGRWDPYYSKYIPSRSNLIYPFLPPPYPTSVGFASNSSSYINTFNAGQDFVVGNEEGIYNVYYYNSGDASDPSSWKENLDGTGLPAQTFDDFTFFRVGSNKNAIFNSPVVFTNKTVVQGYENGQITSNSPISCYGAFELWGNSTYNHNNNTPAYNTVFAGTEYFDPNSTYNIQMWSDTAQKIYDGVNATFGNLTINFNNLSGGFGNAQWKKNYRPELCKGNLKLIKCSGYAFAPVGYDNVISPVTIGGNLQVGDSVLGTYPTLDLSGGSNIPVGQSGPHLTIKGNVDIQSGSVTSQSFPVIQKGALWFSAGATGKKHSFYSYRPFLFTTLDIGDSTNPNIVAETDTLVLKSNLYNAQNTGFLFKDKWLVGGVLDIDTFSINSVNIEVASGGKLITRNRNGIDASLSNQNITFKPGSTLEYAGNETQTFVNAANYHLLNVANVVINNPNNVIMNIPDVTINENLTFLTGSLITDSVNYPTFAQTGWIISTSLSSINGPVRFFTTPFKTWSFYLSNQSVSRYFNFQAVDFSEWKVQFHKSIQPYGNTYGTGINSLCQNEYFTVERLSGSSSAAIGLGWGRNTGVTNPTNLRVAHWNGSLWEDVGNNGWSGDADSGLVYSNFTNYFSPFAIGSSDEQPLPVELTSFNAAVDKNNVTLNWITEHELNNTGFEVQRKTNTDTNWKKISLVQGAINSNSQKNYKYEDKNISTGKYSYRLKQLDVNGNYAYYNLQNEISVGIPAKFNLSQNYPNPFNPSTKINFDLPVDSKVQITVFDITGRLVGTIIDNENYSAGYHTVQFNGSMLASGTYFYRITAGTNIQTKKMTLVK